MILSSIEVIACGGIVLALLAGGESAGMVEGRPASAGLPQTPPSTPAGVGLFDILALVAAPLAVAVFVWRRWYRLAEAPRRPAGFPALAGLAMFIGMYVLGLAGAVVARRWLPGDVSEETLSDLPLLDQAGVLAGHAVGQAVVLAVFLWLAGRAASQDGPARPRAALLGAGAFLGVWPVVVCASMAGGLLAEVIRGEPVDPVAHDTLRLLVDRPVDGGFVAMAVLVVLAVPLLEEVMYRGILQQTFGAAGLGRWPAIITTSAVFALMHVGVVRWHAVPALFVLSLGFGWVYEKTGRLTATVAMHVLFNAANLGLAWLSRPDLGG